MTKPICVWYWFIFLHYVCPFLKISYCTIYRWFCKQNIMWWRRSMRKRKGEKVQSDTVEHYPRSKWPYCGILTFTFPLASFKTTIQEETFHRKPDICVIYLCVKRICPSENVKNAIKVFFLSFWYWRYTCYEQKQTCVHWLFVYLTITYISDTLFIRK